MYLQRIIDHLVRVKVKVLESVIPADQLEIPQPIVDRI